MEQSPKDIEANQGMTAVPLEDQPPTEQPGYGYPPPQPQQQPPGYGQPQTGSVPQPTTVGYVPQRAASRLSIPDIDLPGIAQRSLICGVGLLLVGFAYFILGCISSGVPALAAEGIIIGLLNMGSGVCGILMKFKLLKITTIDSLENNTWFFILFGSVSLATAVGAIRFVVARLAVASALYDRLVRNYGVAAANFALGTSASATTFVLLILILSIVMLTQASPQGVLRGRAARPWGPPPDLQTSA